MNLSNPWVGPLQRSYQQIKGRLISKLKELKHPNGSPLITDVSEGNILVLILSLFSGIAEVIHFYIDNMARETFFSTARRYDSLIKHGRLVDYYPKGATAALTDVIFTRSLTDSNAEVKISAGFTVMDNNGNSWENMKDIIIPANVSQASGRFVQHTLKTNGINTQIVRDTATQELRAYLPSTTSGYYEHLGTTQVTVNDTSYSEVETLAYSKPTDNHFVMVNTEDGQIYLLFGDGKFGTTPPLNATVRGNIYITQGDKGNIEAAAISGNTQGCDYKNMNAGGGSKYEDFDTLKRRIPLSTKTLGVAVTKQDYIDLALQIGEVHEAALEYICGRKLNVYITAIGGAASAALASKVKEYLALHSPLNTWLDVIPATNTDIVLDLDVTGRPSYKAQDIRDAIVSALSAAYPEDGPIGGKVRLSDIYALIDNLPSVDFLYVNQFYVMPWPKVIFGNAQLKTNTFTIRSTAGSAKYLVEFTSESAFKILPYDNITILDSSEKTSVQERSGSIGGKVTMDYPEGFDFDIGFTGTGFKEGYKYIFTVSDTNMDYDNKGFSVPVFRLSSLTLKINETV